MHRFMRHGLHRNTRTWRAQEEPEDSKDGVLYAVNTNTDPTQSPACTAFVFVSNSQVGSTSRCSETQRAGTKSGLSASTGQSFIAICGSRA